MGCSQAVTIGKREFSSQKMAVGYFMDQREAIKLSGPVTQGDFFEELKDLYTRYCECSSSWELNGRRIEGFVVEYELRENGRYAQHLCYKVLFSNKELRPFSVKKAVQAIVKASAE
ncbi:hypothetical protein [Serratia microhaemolytica]|uniref:hypothetical protein n=1 Tax=Serratia microhaemolytica TaxID=2675110 RepID=UPI000FDEF3FA|nr:hypothetical protein [Serratia microhaemolytica]